MKLNCIESKCRFAKIIIYHEIKHGKISKKESKGIQCCLDGHWGTRKTMKVCKRFQKQVIKNTI